MAEWLMALVLKTRGRKPRRFESCPFRHITNVVRQKAGLVVSSESCPFRHITGRVYDPLFYSVVISSAEM